MGQLLPSKTAPNNSFKPTPHRGCGHVPALRLHVSAAPLWVGLTQALGAMTTTHIIMLVGIAVSAVVALIVASQQRRQMRQIELYKQDPSVGLVPPISALTRFVKSKWDTVLGFGIPIVSLALEFMSDAPLTRLSVLIISLNIAVLLTNVVMAVVFRSVDRIFSLIIRITDILEKNVANGRDHFEITKSHTSAIEKLRGNE